MDNHPIENLMKSTMENIKNMIDVDTVVGNPVTTADGTTIIPISKVSFGFASGGSEFANVSVNANERHPFGGGSGAGISLKPLGFLVVNGSTIRFLSVTDSNPYDKLFDAIPQAVDMINEFLHKDDDLTVSPHVENHMPPDCD
ncbi:GerW family sporulation protein [Clostridium culturomicium]|uniref:GerW family sporulation protein n=1 Tax=Clostridium culturomicium TaxID=1499683 RepID=UPI0005A6A8BE|nr:GerW family sporulation protein [Clostridium culturomicium]